MLDNGDRFALVAAMNTGHPAFVMLVVDIGSRLNRALNVS